VYRDEFPADNWERTQIYSKRIRILCLEDVDEYERDVTSRLAERFGSSPLLPRLHSFICSTPSVPWKYFLSSPCLEHFSYDEWLDDNTWHRLLDPMLFEPRESHALPRLSITLAPGDEYLPLLLKLPHLDRLDLNLPHACDISSLRGTDIALRHLSISSSCTAAENVFKSLTTTPLESLDVTCSVSRDDATTNASDWTLLDHFPQWSSTLTHLILKLGRGDESTALPSFGPIQTLRNLEYLSLMSLANIAPTDSEYISMIQSWPAIRVLSFVFGPSEYPLFEPYAGMAVLAAIPGFAPQLERLTISLRLNLVPLQNTQKRSHSLWSLRLLNEVDGDPGKLGVYLDRLFPDLSRLRIGRPSLEPKGAVQGLNILHGNCQRLRREAERQGFESGVVS
ncbi:hypothetical protein DXG01_010704, partial [Tephrocybe rancida]